MTSAMNRSLVSVVTPAYRAEEFIEETMRSVWSQDLRPLEHIVVDDCSPDGTADVAERVSETLRGPDYRVRMIRLAKNLGTAGALNAGLRAAEGDFVAWLSADDLYVQASKTRDQLDILAQDTSLTGVFDWRSYQGADLGSARKQLPYGWPLLMGADRRLWRMDPNPAAMGLMFFNPINGTSILLRRSDLPAPDVFDSELGTFDQDADLWMRILAGGQRIAGRRAAGTMYRVHPGQNSRNLDAMAEGTSVSRIRILLALEDHGLLGSTLDAAGPELWLALGSLGHRRRPSVAWVLTHMGLEVAQDRSTRGALDLMRQDLQRYAGLDREATVVWTTRARELMESPVFSGFADRLAQRG